MSWKINGLVLPIEPTTLARSVQRSSTPVSVTEGFPSSSTNQPTRFELTITGFIFPKTLAEQLDSIFRDPEQEIIQIDIDEETVTDHQWISGSYSVVQSSITRNRPLYDALTGGEVYEYAITFLKESDTPSAGGEGGSGGSNTGTGTDDFAGILGFDANGDGKIDFDELFNWFQNIMTLGVLKE